MTSPRPNQIRLNAIHQVSAKKPAERLRLDEILAGRGWCETRNRARRLIMAGRVRRGAEVLDKPGKSYPADIEITLVEPPRFVSRGGEKLEDFLTGHPIDVTGERVLDVGASAGGFTDCLLQRGAAKAVCVDVGRGQLHGKLRQDSRVTCIEGMNARRLKAGDLPHPDYGMIVMDLSFISLKLALPPVWPLLREAGRLICLVKPQFEARKKEADKGRGIIRDPAIHQRILDEIRAFAAENLRGTEELALRESFPPGPQGNKEFFLALRKNE